MHFVEKLNKTKNKHVSEERKQAVKFQNTFWKEANLHKIMSEIALCYQKILKFRKKPKQNLNLHKTSPKTSKQLQKVQQIRKSSYKWNDTID